MFYDGIMQIYEINSWMQAVLQCRSYKLYLMNSTCSELMFTFSQICVYHLDWSDFTLDLPVHLISWFSPIMFCHFSNFQFLYCFLAAIIHCLGKVLEYIISKIFILLKNFLGNFQLPRLTNTNSIFWVISKFNW